MSQSTSQDGVKELVQAVREVVPGRSNNDIVLVLQYYEHDVARSIQAFLEDGAKDALQEWRSMSVAKTANKKKKKNKKASQANNNDQGATSNVAANQASSNNTNGETMQTKSGTSVPSETGNRTRPTVNDKSSTSSPAASEQNTSSAKPQRPSNSRRGRDNTQTEPKLSKQTDNVQASTTVVEKTISKSDRQSAAKVQPAVKQANAPVIVNDKLVNKAEVSSAVSSAKDTTEAPSVGSSNRSREPSRPKDLPGTTHSHGHSHGHGHGHGHKQESSHGHNKTSHGHVPHPEDSAAKRRPHAGLEKSVKDLARQTSSLQRLKLVLGTELDKSFKKIKEVFEEARRELSEREVEMVQQMDQLKEEANDILQSRQERAAELKMKVERAQVMNEEQIQELRSEIKMFVTDRKIDEDLAHTTRFQYDSDLMKEEIKKFGEVVPAKCFYSTRRPSVSSVASSGVSHDDLALTSPITPTAPVTNTFSSSAVTVVRQTYNVHQVSTQELADLQKRLQNSLKSKSLSASQKRGPQPSNKGSGEKPSQTQAEDGQQKSRSQLRRQRKREMEIDARKNQSAGSENPEAKPPGKNVGNRNKPSDSNDSNKQVPVRNTEKQNKPNERGAPNKEGSGRQNSRRPRRGDNAKKNTDGKLSNADKDSKMTVQPEQAKDNKTVEATTAVAHDTVAKVSGNKTPVQSDVSPQCEAVPEPVKTVETTTVVADDTVAMVSGNEAPVQIDASPQNGVVEEESEVTPSTVVENGDNAKLGDKHLENGDGKLDSAPSDHTDSSVHVDSNKSQSVSSVDLSSAKSNVVSDQVNGTVVNGDNHTDADNTDANMNSTKTISSSDTELTAQPQRKPRVRPDRKAHSAGENGLAADDDVKSSGDVITNGCVDGDVPPAKSNVGKIGDDVTSLILDKSRDEVIKNGDVAFINELDAPEM